jgi:hypothetical protein
MSGQRATQRFRSVLRDLQLGIAGGPKCPEITRLPRAINDTNLFTVDLPKRRPSAGAHHSPAGSSELEEDAEDCNSNKMATASLDHQLNCRCNSCTCELVVTGLRVQHVFTKASGGHADADGWRWSEAVWR